MTPMKPRNRLASARRVVIKIGSRALVAKDGNLDKKVFRSVAEDIARLKLAGKMVALVSSGAILAGRNRLGFGTRKLNMPEKQAAAAVGQNHLMAEWAAAFVKHNVTTGQILLTAEDICDRARFLNSRNTLEELLKLRVVPVINENDTVAVTEIRYGDNDHLSTLIAGLCQADALLILTDIDGLCDSDPAKNPDASVVGLVTESDRELFACAGGSSSGVGSGGMATKIEAARIVARRGIATVIANAKVKGVIGRVMAGEELGTMFAPDHSSRLRDHQYWMAFAGAARGAVRVDDGAKKAVVERGKSLLPSGITAVTGRFDKGDMIRVEDSEGKELARGLTLYASSDLKKIMGKKSGEIEQVLGEKLYDEVIHRDHMVLTAD